MKIEIIKGDLIKLAEEGKFDAIAHGCNCMHTMGSGIAISLNHYTGGLLLEEDKKTPYGDINKLGTFSKLYFNDVWIYNLYTQYIPVHPGIVGVHWNSLFWSLYNMIVDDLIENFDEDHGPINVGIPLIGCGLAGGTKEDFLKTISVFDFLEDDMPITITVVEYDKH